MDRDGLRIELFRPLRYEKSYFHEKDNPYSLPGNTIYFIAEDSLNNIWVSTNNGLTFIR